MTEELHFLPWIRRGLGRTLTNQDLGTGALPRNAPVEAFVEIDRQKVWATLSVRPVDHATAIDASQIVRRYPAADSADAEYGYFPVVDLSAPDVPWVLTPAAPHLETGQLRPWIVLVCVEEALAELVPGVDGRPARLLVPANQLPNLDESHAWAHVQSAVPRNDVESSLTDAPGSVLARLVCPRRLTPNTRYRLAVVAAFAAVDDDVVPAWPRTDGGIEELVVYDTWTMSTGEAGSFEELCERLGPVEDPDLVLGLHRTDVTDLGPADPWPPGTKRVVIDFAGAMWDSDVAPEGLGELADDFTDEVTKLLVQSDHRVVLDLDAPDPVVAPPYYGSFAARPEGIPKEGWMHELNFDPNHRAAAGLGAEVVRIHQERFMAMAWDQAGQLRETNRQLSITRLQAEIARTWKDRTERLDPHQRVAVMRPQLTFVRDEAGNAPRQSLLDSAFPNALVSPAYLRTTRPGGVVATAAVRRNPEGHAWHSSIGDTFGDPDNRDLIDFAAPVAPDGTRFDDTRGDLDPPPGGGGDDDEDPGPPDDWDGDGPLPQLPRRRRRVVGRDRTVTKPTPRPKLAETVATVERSRVLAATTSERFDLAATATLVAASIAPLETGRSRLTARIPGLVDVLADTSADELPTRVAVGPVIDEALVWSLVELSPQLVLPGVDLFPNNAVRVVETNPAFVAAFLAGANHEMARELLWREYPADLAATTFRRFWDRPDPTVHDIVPMTSWKPRQLLAKLGGQGGDTVVVLIRGDLVQHYPTVRVLLVDPATNVASLPTFGGWIPPDVRFMAFDVASADVVTDPDSGWRVVIEEQPTEPRFGLDTIAEGDPPELESWNELSWGHLDDETEPGAHLVIAGALPDGTTIEGATWGRNAAHMAVATFQAPYRLTFDVDDLIGSTDG
jgi:hypothetical protein